MSVEIKESNTDYDGYDWMASLTKNGYFSFVEFGDWPYLCYVGKKDKEIISFCEGDVEHKIFSSKAEYTAEYKSIEKWQKENL